MNERIGLKIDDGMGGPLCEMENRRRKIPDLIRKERRWVEESITEYSWQRIEFKIIREVEKNVFD